MQESNSSSIEADTITVVPLTRMMQMQHDIAQVISAIVHPLLFPLFVIGTTGYVKSNGNLSFAFTLIMFTMILTSLPVATLVWVQVQRGVWSDFDVSQRTQRYTLYPFALLCLTLIGFIYHQLNADFAVWSVLALVIANVINSIINMSWKISAHATTAAACSTLLWQIIPGWGPISLFLTFMVCWSRIILRRHTTKQVIAGSIVGSLSALISLSLLTKLFL
jgi:membrane-associated phospholipid phosphatase